MGLDPSDTSLQIDPANYTVQEIAEAVRDHFEALNSQYPAPADLGMLIGGYGSGDLKPEVWQLDVLGEAQTATLTQPLPPGEPGILQWGQPEAISRIVDGVSLFLPRALTNLGVQAADVDAYVDAIKNQIGLPIVHAGMPLGEAIDLAEFLVDATIKFVRFTPGDAVVGGPIEIAAITTHGAFKWVKRKHYYSSKLNP